VFAGKMCVSLWIGKLAADGECFIYEECGKVVSC